MKPRTKQFALLFALLLSSAAHAAGQTRERFAPPVDHHQHLLSPSSAAAELRATQLPAELERLLRDRRARWNASAGIAALFVEDGALFNGRRWLGGSKAIAAFLSDGF